MLKLKVPRLTTETLYSNVAVRAVNGKGAGAWSEEIEEVVTKKAPESQVENQLFASNRNLAAALKDHEAQDARAHEDNDDGAASDSSSDAPDVVDIKHNFDRRRVVTEGVVEIRSQGPKTGFAGTASMTHQLQAAVGRNQAAVQKLNH